MWSINAPLLKDFWWCILFAKKIWQYFFLWKFSFNESHTFSKDSWRSYFDETSCCFRFGAWTDESDCTCQIVYLVSWSITLWLRRLQRFICHNKEPLLWKLIRCLEPFLTLRWGRKESFTYLCWPLFQVSYH